MAGKAKFDQDAAFKSIIGISEEEQIKGQESIKTLESGKYMPTSGEKKLQEKEIIGRGRPIVTDRETKIRISLAVFPSLYEDIKKIAYVERKSASEIISDCMEQFVKENSTKLKEYSDLKKD